MDERAAGEPDWARLLTLDPEDFTPLYAQLAARLRDAVSELPAGVLLPSEKALMEISGVGRATVRAAVGDLTREGLLVSMRGRGTFTASPRVETPLGRPSGFTETMKVLGLSPSSSVLSVRQVGIDEAVAGHWRVRKGTKAVQIERLRILDGTPAMHERTLLPAARVPGIEQRDLTGSLYELLLADYSISPAWGEETIIAVPADPALAKQLQMPSGGAVLATTRVTFTGDGRPLEYTRRMARGDTCSFTVPLGEGGITAVGR